MTRAKALVEDARGEDKEVERSLTLVETAFEGLGYPYWTARARLDRAGWLARHARHAEAASLAGEAAVTFQQVGAAPMVALARAIVEPDTVQKGGRGGREADQPQLSSAE